MDNYFALMNTETNALLDTRPISCMLPPVPHAPFFGNKLVAASDMLTDNVEVLDRVYAGKEVRHFPRSRKVITNKGGKQDAAAVDDILTR